MTYKRGKIYVCKLSSKDVLIVEDNDYCQQGYYFNEQTGLYEYTHVHKGRLRQKYNTKK